MSMKSKVIAAAATLTLVGGVSAVATFSASAARSAPFRTTSSGALTSAFSARGH